MDGHKVAIPVGEDWRFDLIVLKDGKLQRVQCKYVTSDGRSISIPCLSCNNWSRKRYTPAEIDWIAAYDSTTGKFYYIPSAKLGEHGRTNFTLRIQPSKNNQQRRINYARDYESW